MTDDFFEDAVIGRAGYFDDGSDAHVAHAGLPVKHFNSGLAVRAFRGHRRHVRPIESLDQVDQRQRLIRVGRYGSSEELETRFITQNTGRGGWRDLRNAEEAQEIGHLDRDGTVGAADDSEDGTEALGPGPRRRTVQTFESARVHGVEGGSDELERPVQRVRVPGAGIDDGDAQLDSGQKLRLVVDAVNGEEHGLQPLDAAVVDGISARRPLAFDVDGEQSAQNEVTGQFDGRRRALHHQSHQPQLHRVTTKHLVHT